MGVPPAARMPSFTLAESRQVEITGHGFDPGVGHADQGTAEVGVSEADRFEHGARPSPVAPFGNATADVLGIHG